MQGLSGFVVAAAKKKEKQRKRNRSGCPAALVRRKAFTAGDFYRFKFYSSVERAGVKRISFCCSQSERNAAKERKNAAKTKSGIFLLKL